MIIEGKCPLDGHVEIGGAKNAALPIMAATLLTSDDCLIENAPYIEDIRIMVDVIHQLGVAARFEAPNVLRIKATRINRSILPLDLARRMRASFLVVGPLLARFGQAEAPHPGGCAIGTRPVSVDLKAFQSMGADVNVDPEYYVIKAPRLQGQRIILDYPSHTGTENVLMAACLAEGATVIENASIEPEVIDLAGFLSAMGARIYGAGTSVIRIDGVRRLHGAAYRVMPDRMEAGTFALGALISGGQVSMQASVARWLGALTGKMRDAGATVTTTDVYRVEAPQILKPADIQTYPYPGFPTDLQAPFTTVMTQAHGNASIHETMFEDRLRYVSELRKMGASIDVSESGRTAMVHGPSPLCGTAVTAMDIRSGAAMVLAGLAAEGVTEIANVIYIDRGYENFAGKMASLGASVERREESSHKCPVELAGEPIDWGVVPFSVGVGVGGGA